MAKKVVLVTGGTGLVGNGIRIAHERDPRDNESFIFLSSKDADLTDKESTRKVRHSKKSKKSSLCVKDKRQARLGRFCFKNRTHLMFQP